MKHPIRSTIVRKHTFTRLTARLSVMVLFAALLLAAPFQAALATTNFAVLGGTAVTLTSSVVTGDVGSLGAFTNTGSTISGTVHLGDQVAIDAYAAFIAEYNAIALEPCDQTLAGDLTGLVLSPGVYCVAAASTTTGGTLTLDGSPTDTWIFKIGTGGTGALTGTNFTVVMSNNQQPACPNNVIWWTAEAATLTDSAFIGSILAGTSITVTGGTFDGDAWAKAAVTLTDTTVSGCGGSVPVPPVPLGSIKVTGGGQIPVPDPASNGRASFGFNAQPDKKGGAKGEFNYVNHVTGLHINGKVDNIVVIEVNLDNSPKTVLFSGTYNGGSFIVRVQDNGEPGRNDQFGITITGSQSEIRSMRVISNGNIQFHK